MSQLFISDLHLSSDSPARTRAFFHFLRHRAVQAEALYILGDLFEMWIGDDDPAPLAREVCTALIELRVGGTEVFLQHGNRDFAIGRQFCRETGATLLDEPTLIRVQGQKILLMHGDSLCIDDKAYQRFRRLVRNPMLLALLKRLPLKLRRELAAGGRKQSVAANRNKPEAIMDVNPRAVIETMEVHQAPVLIHGHTHRPGEHRVELSFGSGRRLVLGDWDQLGWVIVADKGRINLESFVLESFD